MDARRSWIWILVLLTMNFLSLTSSELVKRQDTNEQQIPLTSNPNSLPDTNLPSTLNEFASANDPSFDISTTENNEELPDQAVTVKTLSDKPKNNNTLDSHNSTEPIPNTQTDNNSLDENFSKPFQIMESNSEPADLITDPTLTKTESVNGVDGTVNTSITTSPQVGESNEIEESNNLGINQTRPNINDTRERPLSNFSLQEVLERKIILETIPPKSDSTAAIVYNMLEPIELKKSTDDYVTQFNRRYALLPQIESDNLKWTKFSRAVAETFVLDFSRIYEKENNSTQENNSSPEIDDEDDDYHLDYNETYNLAISHLKEKKGQTALQLAVPVRRASDIFKAVLAMPIGVVQSKCKAYMSVWQCHAEYLAKLTDESEVCDHVWHHAELHLKILKTLVEKKANTNDPIDIIIETLESRIKSVKKNDSNYLFNFIIKTLRKLRSRLKGPLISNAKVFDYVNDSQKKGLLRCMNIDQALY